MRSGAKLLFISGGAGAHHHRLSHHHLLAKRVCATAADSGSVREAKDLRHSPGGVFKKSHPPPIVLFVRSSELLDGVNY